MQREQRYRSVPEGAAGVRSSGQRTMSDWLQQLKSDSIAPPLSFGNEALRYFAKRDLLGGRVGPVDRLWQLPE